jgi:hypothetical protein
MTFVDDELWCNISTIDHVKHQLFSAECKNHCHIKSGERRWWFTYWRNGIPFRSNGGVDSIYP